MVGDDQIAPPEGAKPIALFVLEETGQQARVFGIKPDVTGMAVRGEVGPARP